MKKIEDSLPEFLALVDNLGAARSSQNCTEEQIRAEQKFGRSLLRVAELLTKQMPPDQSEKVFAKIRAATNLSMEQSR